jgi:hypothetical protein
MTKKLKIGGYAESTVRAYWDFYAECDMPSMDEDDADLKVLVSAYDPKSSTITITPDTAAAIRCALCTLSNAEDETYERERRKAAEVCDVEFRDAARHAARGLSGLYIKACAVFA